MCTVTDGPESEGVEAPGEEAEAGVEPGAAVREEDLRKGRMVGWWGSVKGVLAGYVFASSTWSAEILVGLVSRTARKVLAKATSVAMMCDS